MSIVLSLICLRNSLCCSGRYKFRFPGTPINTMFFSIWSSCFFGSTDRNITRRNCCHCAASVAKHKEGRACFIHLDVCEEIITNICYWKLMCRDLHTGYMWYYCSHATVCSENMGQLWKWNLPFLQHVQHLFKVNCCREHLCQKTFSGDNLRKMSTKEWKLWDWNSLIQMENVFMVSTQQVMHMFIAL